MRSVCNLIGLAGLAIACVNAAFGIAAAAPASPEIRDPLYAFIIEASESDVLGSWSQADLRSHVEQSGRPTRLPLDRIQRISRRPVLSGVQPGPVPLPNRSMKPGWTNSRTNVTLGRPLPRTGSAETYSAT